MDANCFFGTLLVMCLVVCCNFHSRLETDFDEDRHKKKTSDNDLYCLLEAENENNSEVWCWMMLYNKYSILSYTCLRSTFHLIIQDIGGDPVFCPINRLFLTIALRNNILHRVWYLLPIRNSGENLNRNLIFRFIRGFYDELF